MADNTLLWVLGLAGAGIGYVWYKNDQAKKACAGTWTGGFLSGNCAPLPLPPPPEVQKQPVVVADGEIKLEELVVAEPPKPEVPPEPKAVEQPKVGEVALPELAKPAFTARDAACFALANYAASAQTPAGKAALVGISARSMSRIQEACKQICSGQLAPDAEAAQMLQPIMAQPAIERVAPAMAAWYQARLVAIDAAAAAQEAAKQPVVPPQPNKPVVAAEGEVKLPELAAPVPPSIEAIREAARWLLHAYSTLRLSQVPAVAALTQAVQRRAHARISELARTRVPTAAEIAALARLTVTQNLGIGSTAVLAISALVETPGAAGFGCYGRCGGWR